MLSMLGHVVVDLFTAGVVLLTVLLMMVAWRLRRVDDETAAVCMASAALSAWASFALLGLS